MKYKIEKVAVLGSGVMGRGIAALLAGLDFDVLMLDIVPPGEPSSEEIKKGITKESKEWRNKIVQSAIDALLQSRPPALISKSDVEKIKIGNFEDDFDKIRDADWIIEAVVERMDIKRQLFAKVAQYRKPGSIVSSNTSGLSINGMVEGLPDEFCEHFLGTHFFNPPRYMKLLEIIPCKKTKKEVLDFMKWFCTEKLGKGVIMAKDTPNFVANRLGVHGIMYAMKLVESGEFSVSEMDTVLGEPMGRPKSALFRTADLVGLDTLYHVTKTVYDGAPQDEERDVFKPPVFLEEMIKKGWLGDKSKGGFYKKEKKGDGERRLVLNPKSLEYETAPEKVEFESLSKFKKLPLEERLKRIVYADDRAGQLAWKFTARTLAYASRRIPEIADDIVTVDNAMKWGFNFEKGPFEVWDIIGVRKSVERMEAEGIKVADWVKKMLAKGYESFYVERNGDLYYYDVSKEDYVKLEKDPKIISLVTLRKQGKVVWENEETTIYDMGDGVLCLEFHNRYMNAIGPDILDGMEKALQLLEDDKWVGLVIGHEPQKRMPEAFCAGANVGLILMAINSEAWDEINKMAKRLQDVNMRMKYNPKPVVAALAGLALGGGCEIILHMQMVVASIETYAGLVELGVGVIPAGGGTKEMVLRYVENLPSDYSGDLMPFARKAFENIALARVSSSAKEAVELRFLRPTDKIVANRDYLLYEAKQAVLALSRLGNTSRRPRNDIPVVGESGWAAFHLFARQQHQAGFITEYEVHLATQLAKVISGGKVAPGTKVSEQYLLDLEREVFVELCKQPKTKERIMHFVMHKKPLRN